MMMLSSPLTRRFAPPSPRKRGEVGNRSAKSQIMATLLSPLGRGQGEGWVTL
jgi:hypothetical protein